MSYNHKFGQVSLVCHAFNADASEMAISLNSNDVFIFQVPQVGRGKFVFLDRLQEHTATVRSIDWASKTDRIVSCSKDRNAYVWTRSGKTWKPTLVILQLNRAATFVRWSPLENKFAVGSGAKIISVCCFDVDNDFWVSRHLKKAINSTVTCLDWHPDNNVLACGSTDFRVRIFSAYLKSNDSESKGSEANCWGGVTKFNALLWEGGRGEGGWVHAVSFSPDGKRLMWCSHASIVGLATAGGADGVVVQSIQLDVLPFQTLVWAANNTVVAAGHDCVPYAIHTESNLRLGASLDSLEVTDSNTTKSAINKFQQIDRTADNADVTVLNSVHQNAINELRILKGTHGGAQVLTSVGRDGQIVMWDLKTLQQRMAQLKIC